MTAFFINAAIITIWVVYGYQLYFSHKKQRIVTYHHRLNWLFLFLIVLTFTIQRERAEFLIELFGSPFSPNFFRAVCILLAVHIVTLILHDEYPQPFRWLMRWIAPICLIGAVIVYVVGTQLYFSGEATIDGVNFSVLVLRDIGMVSISLMTLPVLFQSYRREAWTPTRLRLVFQMMLVVSVVVGALDSVPALVTLYLGRSDAFDQIVRAGVDTNVLSGLLIILWLIPFRYFQIVFIPGRIQTWIRLHRLNNQLQPPGTPVNWSLIFNLDQAIYREFIAILDFARNHQYQPVLDVADQYSEYWECARRLAALQIRQDLTSQRVEETR